MERARHIAGALASFLGADATNVRIEPLSGGCINRAAKISLAGRSYFAKWNDHPLPRQFAAEAAGLTALAAAHSRLTVPRPILFDDTGDAFLVTSFLASGTRTRDFDETLGTGLAELHRHTDARGFGFEMDGYCGATPQPNGWCSNWVEFYQERRLRHQLELARQRGIGSSALAVLERVLDRLPQLLDASDPPALIHGDLWSGNLHVGPSGEPALIDPAAYFGHREAELGMMVMFGGFGRRVFDAYDATWPLVPGWRERLPLYTLYHVLNHYNLFGGAYGEQAVRIAKQFSYEALRQIARGDGIV